MKRKKYLVILVGIVLVMGLALAGVAGAATSDSKTVSFTVLTTQAITAVNLPLGNVYAGLNDLGNKQPVTVNSNVAWKVEAQANADFVDTGVTVDSKKLTMGGQAIPTAADTPSVVNIATGSAGGPITPNIATTLDVPWGTDLVGKTLSATITYTVAPQ